MFHDDQYGNQVTIKVMEPDPLLCPPYAYGYSLSRKDWCRFFIDLMDDVKWKEGMWDSLILASEQKLVLQALVTSHEFPENARDEPEQKGKGLVILLYGTPGSGKTLTAETAAEGAQKALISASLGDLNRENRPWLFELRLKQVLTYATMWKAVVLLDEADVFLEARQESLGDGTRNALVAVFLRELEYFSGIVFLTTNRIETFDQAMKSRIHLALEYSPPDIEIRRQVWMNLLGRVPEDAMGIEDLDDAVENILMEKLNGREISNTLNTARTLARFKKEKLGLEHIESVLQVRRDFDRSVQRKAKRTTSRLTDLSTIGGCGLIRQGSIAMADAEVYES
jgi:SpoVK/Ycf46/Vps4 family AAA+-type ATPase